MAISSKVISDSTSTVAVGTTEQVFEGLAMIMNQCKVNEARLLYVGLDAAGNQPSPPAPAFVWALGSTLHPNDEPQCQFQDERNGSNPSYYWVACLPFAIAPGSTIVAHEDAHSPTIDSVTPKHTFTTSSFVVPAVSATVSIEVLSTAAFAVGDYVDRATNTGVFIGGLFFDITAIADSTHMTIRNRGLPGAIITAIG
jgi:hypothetical protein